MSDFKITEKPDWTGETVDTAEDMRAYHAAREAVLEEIARLSPALPRS